MEKIQVEKVTPDEAAGAMRAAGLVDPAGIDTPESIAENGSAFRVTTAGGTGVFVAEKQGARLWITGAGGVASSGLTGVGLGVIEAMAGQGGCDAVGFQTGRPGLVKLAKKRGYRVVGFIMEKKIK